MSRDQYLGNPNLKKGHTKSRFSKERIEEVLKCLDDPKYFYKLFEDCQLIKVCAFEMYDFQKDGRYIPRNRFTICKLPRQSVKSTIIVSYSYIMFYLMIMLMLRY